MEYLDMTYADETPEVNPQSQGMLDMLYFFIDAGITKKEPTDGDALSKELDQPAQELLHGILETAPEPQDKALVTALINKYKNLDSDQRDIAEFKEHLKNMVDSNALGYGALNYLLERVTSGDVKDKNKGIQPQPPQQQQPEQPQPEQPEGGDQGGGEQQQQGQQGAADTNNSDLMTLNYIEEWDDNFSAETDLTEDDFSDILEGSIEDLVSNQEVIEAEPEGSSLRSSESKKVQESHLLSRAKTFLKSKYRGEDVRYSSLSDQGFERAATFLILKEAEYTNLPNVIEPMNEVTNLDLSDENKVELSKIKARKFLAKKDKAFHGGMSLVHPSMSVSDSEGPNSIQSGSSRIKLESKKDDRDHDGEQDYKLDIRGNLETSDMGYPIMVPKKSTKKFKS